MNHVFEHSVQKHSERLVLLVLADHADPDGFCWPSLPKIAERAGLTVRQVRRSLRKIEKTGEIVSNIGRGIGHPSSYTIKPDRMSGVAPKPDNLVHGNRTKVVKHPGTNVRRSVSEPSGDPSWLQKQASKEAELVQTKEQADLWVKQYSSLYGGFPYLPDAIKTALGFPP